MNVNGLLADGHLCGYRSGCNGEADTDTGRKDLREGARIDYYSVLVEALYIRNILARNAEVAVGIVLENHNAVSLCELIKLFALFKRHRDACGILKVRNGIYHFGVRVLVESLFESLDIHAVRLHGHADDFCVVGAEAVE